MNKPVLGLIIGGTLGVFDGLTALVSAPEVAPQIMSIVIGSMGKGLVAGLIMGFVARKVNNLPVGVIVGLVVGAALALPIAMMKDPNTGQVYFWEILIPGSIVGLIVGYATQRYGTRPQASIAR
jgi:membrane protease YdiL (CAAX protease family)